MGDMMEKVSRLRSLFPDLDIEVDGGVGTANIEQVARVRSYMSQYVQGVPSARGPGLG